LKEIWPSQEEVYETVDKSVLPEMFVKQYSSAFTSNEKWNAIEITTGDFTRGMR
jgi:aconitate hydratase